MKQSKHSWDICFGQCCDRFNQLCPILSTWYEWKNTFHNLYERTSCLDWTDRVVEWKMHLISLLGTATKLSSRTNGQVFLTRQTELSSGNSFYANRREGTSALHTVYASFTRSICNDTIWVTRRNKRATHCISLSENFDGQFEDGLSFSDSLCTAAPFPKKKIGEGVFRGGGGGDSTQHSLICIENQ